MGNQNLKENQMKFTFAVATIATLSQAYYLDEFVKDAPRGMGRPINRFEGARGEKKVLDEPYDYSSLPKKCVGRVKQFDRYCHNVGKFRKDGRKYSDFRDDDLQCSYCEMGEDGLCIDRDEEPKQFHCIAQQCAFDYCKFSRDLYAEACRVEIVEEEAKKAPELPNWDDVYNYDELHGDYLLWYESNGEEGFTTDMCVAYYKMYDGAELRDELAASDDEDEEDEDEFDEDDMDMEDEEDEDDDSDEDMGDEGEGDEDPDESDDSADDSDGGADESDDGISLPY